MHDSLKPLLETLLTDQVLLRMAEGAARASLHATSTAEHMTGYLGAMRASILAAVLPALEAREAAIREVKP